MFAVYCILNTVNGMKYIGSTSEKYLTARKSHHLTGRGNRLLFEDVKKHGRDKFEFFVIHDNITNNEDKEILEASEISICGSLAPCGYNISPNGKYYKAYGKNHPMYGKNHSSEAKRKISQSAKGRILPTRNPLWKRAQEIVKMNNNGISQRKIAKMFGCNRTLIKKIIETTRKNRV